MASLSLQLSKRHIVGNHMSWLISFQLDFVLEGLHRPLDRDVNWMSLVRV